MTSHLAFAARGWIVALVTLSAGSVAAQEAVLAEFYGSGVHQYFAGNADQAVSHLSAAINGGSKDPRAYYFRALAEMRLGRQAQATADLQKGAALESADANQFYPVGKSLERVQGATRMTIERYRSLARAEAHQRRHDRDAVRYEQRRRAESQVLRSSGTAPVGNPPAALAPAVLPPAAAAVADDDPFADAVEKPSAAKPAEAAPAAEKPPADESPDEGAPKDEPEEMKSDDAVDEPPAAPPEAKSDEPKGDDDNPFGDDPPAAK